MPEPKAKRRRISDNKECKSSELTEKFGVKFNPDIELLWKWAHSRSSKDPLNCLHSLLNLKLCGPFRYLHDTAKTPDSVPRDVVALHMLDREWQCPPELQPCAHNDTHLFGLWRDTPTEEPKFVVEKEKGCGVITPVATDTLDLIRILGKKHKVELPEDLKELIESQSSTEDLKRIEAERRKSVVAKTFNKIGIVVPISASDVGYRPLTMSYSELDRMLTKCCKTDDENEKDKILAPFDECINYIQFANDECDYGMGFEMGMCVFSHETSRNFMGTISSLLPLAYQLLGRNLYSKIMKRICEEEETQPTQI